MYKAFDSDSRNLVMFLMLVLRLIGKMVVFYRKRFANSEIRHTKPTDGTDDG